MKTVFVLCTFLLALAIPARCFGADVTYFGVVKAGQYQQTNDSSAPVLLSTNAFRFDAFVVASTNGLVTNATVKAGAGGLYPLLPVTNDMFWSYEKLFNSQTDLDAAFPGGGLFSLTRYTMTMSCTNDGIRTADLAFGLLGIPISYPAVAQLTNLAAAQSLDPTRDFELGWGALGNNLLEIVQLTILDSASNVVFMTPAPFQPGALSNVSRSAVIPANTLPAGADLQGHLTLANPGEPNTNSYAGAYGVAALARDTGFTLRTRAAPVAPTVSLSFPAAAVAKLHVAGDTNRLFQIQTSSNLVDWLTVFTTNSMSGTFDYTDPEPGTLPARCYRVKVGQ